MISHVVFAQGKHTFHIEGQQPIEGELISVLDGEVEIKRLEDGQIIKTSISSLAVGDKKYLLSWVRNKGVYTAGKPPLPEGWGTLRIHMPKGYNLALGSEMGNMTRVAGRIHEADLPIGFWVKVNTYRTDPINSEFRSTFLQFKGHSDWYLSLRAGRLYRRYKPDGPPKIVAAVIPRDNEIEFVRSLRNDAFAGRDFREDQQVLADHVSLRVTTRKGMEALEVFHHPIARLSIDEHFLLDENGQLDVRAADRLVKLAPQSLSMEGGDEILTLLSRIPSIEHLILKEPESSPWTFQGVQSLRKLPRLQSLKIRSRGNADFLQGFDKLKILRVDPILPYGSKVQIPELKSLEAFSMPELFILDESSLAGFPRIKHLSVRGIDPSYRPPGDLIHVTWRKEGGDYNTPVTNGLYHNLRSLTTVEHVDYSKLPNLSRLAIVGITPDMPSIAKAPRLRHLQLYEVQQADLEQLVKLPNMQDLETIAFFRGTITDLSPLGMLPKLKQIHLDRLREAPHLIDLTEFPVLECFKAFNVYQMESIIGVASHPNLIFLQLTNCREIRSLGRPAPNDRLDSIYINDAIRLENMGAFRQMIGLKAAWITGCTEIKGPLYIEDNNNLVYCKIYNSGSLPNRPKME